MGKCGVFIPYHSHQVIPIPILMELAWRFPFPWESHGTHGIHGNSQYILIPNRQWRRQDLLRGGAMMEIMSWDTRHYQGLATG